MFSSFKLVSLRPRTKSLSNSASGSPPTSNSILCKPRKSSLGSPKQKKNHQSQNNQIVSQNKMILGNAELGQSPNSLASLRPGSAIIPNDQTSVDGIYSVNDTNASRMHLDNLSTLSDNIDGNNALLEFQYNLPNYVSQNSLCVSSKVTEVAVERIGGSIGITLRGGLIPEHPHLNRPLIITHVRPNGPAHRTGRIQVGDRLLKVDHFSLANKTLLEAQQLLSNQTGFILTSLTIEYDVNLMESIKYANGPLLVEIDRQNEDDFGLVLTNCFDFGEDNSLVSGYFIEHIIAASLADRCGALNVGDQIIAIDDIVLESWRGTAAEAENLLRKATKLETFPSHSMQRSHSRTKCGIYNSLSSKRSRQNHINRRSIFQKSLEVSDYGSNRSYGCSSTNTGVCHLESLNVTLVAQTGEGFGLAVSVGDHSETRTADILVSKIFVNSPAYRCGCLQVGDRIILVNQQPNLTLQEINSLLEAGNDTNSIKKISLQIEFDVADTIIPSRGIFTVKLAKRGPDLGITITASKFRPDEPFIISEIRKGSIAHRTGTLHAGDRLLAIDNRPLDHISLETAFEILQASTNDIVTLKIEKTETENTNLFLDSVVYTVELHRYGGPLGITISGSEDCLEPIILSRLTEGGLAEITGALHVGDRILAINGENLENRPLSDAIRLLQTSEDRVQLKIARNIKLIDENRLNYSSPGLMSIDSAVHSWDSNPVDNLQEESELHKDGESVSSELLSHQDLNQKSKHDSQLQFYSDTEDIFCPSPLPLPNYNFSNHSNYGESSNRRMNKLQGTCSNESILDNEIYHVTLYKDSIYDDYGFSVSDGLYEKGVYINRIRKGGPADIVGLLKPYDRIIQVNDTKTKDFDCCLTVPLIASAGDRIELLIARNPYLVNSYKDYQDDSSKVSLPTNQNTIIKTL